MENRNIIIILLVIIVVLAAAIGVMLLNPTNAKEPVKVKIISDTKQYEDDGEVSIKLTDSNGTAISKEVVNITVTNSKGKVVVDDVVKTDSNGKANLVLDLKKGKYNVSVSYGGNKNFTGNNSTQKLTIKEKEIQTEESSTTNYEDVQKVEFNGKTHEQNVQEAKESRDRGGQWAGATDEQIEEMVSKEERDGGRI